MRRRPLLPLLAVLAVVLACGGEDQVSVAVACGAAGAHSSELADGSCVCDTGYHWRSANPDDRACVSDDGGDVSSDGFASSDAGEVSSNEDADPWTPVAGEPHVYFHTAHILGATPVVAAAGGYRPVCRTTDLGAGQSLAGLAIDLTLTSTERKVNNETIFDQDRSIQPGDTVNRHLVQAADLSPTTVRVQVDCLTRTSTATPGACDPAADLMAPASEVVTVEHLPFASRAATWGDGEGAGNGIVVLLDQSGSVSGFVQPDPTLGYYEMPYDEANLAVTKWEQQGHTGTLDLLASDKRHYRQAALAALVEDLNSNDKLLVTTYNEDYKNRLICRGPELASPTMEDCFTTRRDWLSRGMDDIPGNEGGRTPLWESVYHAYRFLEGQQGLASRHLIVIGDGPDTCHPGSEAFRGGPPCSDVDFGEFRALVEGGGSDVHLHFIQYQAPGYRERDVRQMEMACLSEGTYTFINRLDMENVEFESALIKAIQHPRYALLGKWRVIVQMDAPSLDLPWPQGTPAGGGYALLGDLTLQPIDTFLITQEIFHFQVGDQSTKQGLLHTPAWDNSLVFRKGCATQGACGGSDADVCVARCGWESQLCLPPTNAPTGTFCLPEGGAPGLCCEGVCQDVNEPCP